MAEDHRQETPDNFITQLRKNNLFWNISGAAIKLLEKSYTDHNKYKNLGAAIFFTAVFATISAGFALSYLTTNWWVILPVSILWGFTILNIDMMIVNTINNNEKSSWKSVAGFLARVLMGTIIALSISVPVEMTLLKDEIRDEIDANDRKAVETEKNKVKTEFDQLAGLKARKDTLQLKFIDEMQGKPNASGYRGYGVISKKIEKDLVELDSMIKVLELRKDTTLRATVNKVTANQEANNKYGFLGSFRALYRLQHKSEDNSVWMISMGIKLLLLMIELMPILSKTLMSRGAYNALYEMEEQKLIQRSDSERKNLTT